MSYVRATVFMRLLCLFGLLVLIRYGTDAPQHVRNQELERIYRMQVEQEEEVAPLNLDIDVHKLRYSYFIYLFGDQP